MESSIAQKKLKWRGPSDPTKFGLYYPPAEVRKTAHWDSWMSAMMMDTRLLDSDRAILTRIALHYNLKTGACFPSHGRIAIEIGFGDSESGETGAKAVTRTVTKAVQLGWIKRTFRHGGPAAKNQTNLYELTLPQSIREVLTNTGPEPSVVATDDFKWRVVQTKDGICVCGPFEDHENAARWLAEHGPRGQIREARGHRCPTEGTSVSDRGDVGVPQNRESNREENREVIEHLFFKEASSPRSDAPSKNLSEERRGEFEADPRSPAQIPPQGSWRGYTEDEVAFVEGAIENFDIGTLGGILACAREHGYFITGNVLARMCADGRFRRDGDNIWLVEAAPAEVGARLDEVKT